MRAVVSCFVTWTFFFEYTCVQSSNGINKVLDLIGLGRGREIVNCYEDLGCFEHTTPWYSISRPFPTPMSRAAIGTKILLYTPINPTVPDEVNLHGLIRVNSRHFDATRPSTVFIVHGFASSGQAGWVNELKNVYIKKRNANIFVVDWSGGSNQWNYLQVAANTRIVGEELKRFGKHLIQKRNINASSIHLIGHCLGAHILAYMGKSIPGIGHLTAALDPTQPGFEGFSSEVMLHKGDANFIDVIHTDSNPFIPMLGFGMTLPAGDVDFYVNGGLFQPQCVIPPRTDQIQVFSIKSLEKFSVEILSHYISCSHDKAYLYYIESLANDYCTFWGRAGGVIGTALDLISFGWWDAISTMIYGCTLNTCSPMGLATKNFPGRGVFSVWTHTMRPYCANNPEITSNMLKQKEALSKKEKHTLVNENRKNLKEIITSFIRRIFYKTGHRTS